MKKKYEKPGLYIENFALSQTIAAGSCGDAKPEGTLGYPTHIDVQTCGWNSGAGVYWIDNNSVCTDKRAEDDEILGMCYNNPEGMTVIFAYS